MLQPKHTAILFFMRDNKIDLRGLKVEALNSFTVIFCPSWASSD